MRGQVGDDATPSRFRWPDGTSWTPPTTEELLSRGAAAVAREYLRPLPRLPRTLDSAAPAINGRRVRGDVDVNAQRTGKSRKALSSDDDAKRNAVCNSFLKGRCLYAERCKFSHDLELYLAQKQPDLPGEVSFRSGKYEHMSARSCMPLLWLPSARNERRELRLNRRPSPGFTRVVGSGPREKCRRRCLVGGSYSRSPAPYRRCARRT